MADPAAGSPDRDDPSTFDASRVIQLLRVFLTAAKDDAPQQPDAHEDQGWETSGCTLWDLAALEHPAAVLAAAGGVPMLQLLATTMMERQQWRAAEISLGTLANLACHPEPRRDMAQSAALAEVAVQRALWADDPATVGEACRLASTVLSASHDVWQAPLSSAEGLGRLAWILECTTSTEVLERTLVLVQALLAAAADRIDELAAALCSLGAVPLLASVVQAWTARLRLEEDEFQAAPRADGPPTEAAVSAPGPALHAQGPAAPSQVAADVTEASALEALGALDSLTSSEAGAAAVAADGGAVAALVQLLAAADSRDVQLRCASVLVTVDAQAGRCLLATAGGVQRLLELLAAAAESEPAADDGEAGVVWSLCSSVMHAVTKLAGEELCQRHEVLASLCAAAGALAARHWAAWPEEVQRHQRYCSQRLADVLARAAGGAGEEQRAMYAQALRDIEADV